MSSTVEAPVSVFESLRDQAWPIEVKGEIHVHNLAGGVPSDPKVAEGWLKTKLTNNRDDLVREMVADTMAARGVDANAAAKIVDEMKHTNGFKRDDDTGQLYIEGRQFKAALKEAVSIAAASGKIAMQGWGMTNKFIQGYTTEHIVVMDERLPLYLPDALGVPAPVTEPDQIVQSFPKNPRTGQTGIQNTEVLFNARFSFTLRMDHDFTTEQLAMIMLTGQEQGIGASRSQGYGRYTVTRWDRSVLGPVPEIKKKAVKKVDS